jgi:hypothetical protein
MKAAQNLGRFIQRVVFVAVEAQDVLLHPMPYVIDHLGT